MGEATEVRHFDYIDSLRGVAILGVMAVHLAQTVQGMPGVFYSIMAGGQLGVQLFFVVSACTLFHSQFSRELRSGRPNWPAFFIRRLFRVAPLFWIAAAIYPFIRPSLLSGHSWAPDGVFWPQLLSTFLFVHGWHPIAFNAVVPGGWSIGVEMMFYLSFPLLFRFIRTPAAALWALLITSLVVRFTTLPIIKASSGHWPKLPAYLVEWWVTHSFPAQLPVFIAGIAAFFIARTGLTEGLKRLVLPSTILVLAAGFDILPPQVIAGLAFGLLICLAPTAGKWLNNRFLKFVGTVSFSIYIWHFAIIDLAVAAGLTRIAIPHLPEKLNNILSLGTTAVFVAFISVVVATLSYHAIELPGIRVGKWLLSVVEKQKKPCAPITDRTAA